MTQDDPDYGDWEPPSGWVPLGQRRWSRLLVLGGFGFSLFLVFPAVEVLGKSISRLAVLESLEPWVASAIAFVLALGIVAGILLLIDRTSPRPRVDFGTGQVRAGRRTAPIESIDRATLVPTHELPGTETTLTLMLQGGGMKFGVVLHGVSWTLRPEYRFRVAELLRLSSVSLPKPSYDPTGKFARYNFPGSLTKEDAIALVLDPPGPYEPLPMIGGTPIPERRRRIK